MKKRKWAGASAGALLTLAVIGIGIIWAAGTVTQTYSSLNTEVASVTFSWAADATAATVPDTESTYDIDGWVFMVVTDPGATAPTANYDLTLEDEAGVDVMGGTLANRSDTASEQALPLLATGTYGERFVEGKLTMTLSNNSVTDAVGTVKVYFRKYRSER